MKPFAFLAATPAYARENNCGQYNGYIVFDEEADKYLRTMGDYGYADYHTSGLEEVTFCQCMDGAKLLDGWKDKIFITDVPEDARTRKLIIYGFDTCHIGDTWDTCGFDAVKARTLAWLADTNAQLEEYIEDAKYYGVALVISAHDDTYSFCVINIDGEYRGDMAGKGTCRIEPQEERGMFSVEGEYKGEPFAFEYYWGAGNFERIGISNAIHKIDKYACIGGIYTI